MTHSQVLMVGGGAIAARPHIGAGVTKADEDARALDKALENFDNINPAMSSYNNIHLTPNIIACEHVQHK